ncbi:MAG: hypothetical protein ACOYEQ_01945 [Bacillota bacterium]|jgi:hypothetical protein
MQKLLNLDRRIIYVVLALVVAIPLARPVGLPFGVTEETQKAYATVEALKPGDAVVFDFGYDAGGASELHPQAEAFFAHCMKKGLRVIAFSLDQQGPRFAEKVWEEWADSKEYGKDFVNLGFFAGDETALASFGKNISGFVAGDYYSQSTEGMDIFDGINTAEDVDLFIRISKSSILPFIQYFQGPYGKPVTGGAIGTQISNHQAYVESGQLQGYLGSLRGAAEYEQLLSRPGDATAVMDAQSAAHVFVVLLIVLGNIGEFAAKRAKISLKEGV